MLKISEKLSAERLPLTVPHEDHNVQTEEEVEAMLQEHLESGNLNALFPVGQFYYQQGQYKKAMHYFEVAANRENDWQAIFQLGVMYYDGLGCEPDMKRGFEYMLQVAKSGASRAQHLIRAAQFNVGLAYYEGFGVRRSDEQAERYWLMAADNGNPKASVKAQSVLGLFYSLHDYLDLKKAFYWHSEACGNGSLESQGALGVMYLEGLGVKKNLDKAFICLRDAAHRGNVYAMGQLIGYYYQRKMYTKAVELASKVSLLEDTPGIGRATECMENYIKKGISMACFYYGRCLALGHGVQRNEDESKRYFSLSFKFDPDTCASLHTIAQFGEI